MTCAEGKVAEVHEHAVPIITKAKVAATLQLVYEVEAISMMGVLVWLQEPPVQERNVRCVDPQRTAQVMIPLQSLVHAC